MKKFLLVAVISVFALVLTACGGSGASSDKANGSGKAKDGGSLIIGVTGDPEVINPNYASDRVTLTIQQAVYAPLFWEVDGKPALAKSLDISDDNLTYTVKLKDGLTWHDGKPLTADDVVFTVSSILDTKQNSPNRGNFVFDNKPVKVEAVDDTTVKFTLPTVAPAFENTIKTFFPIPKHIFEGVENIEKSDKNKNPIGSGPYKFVEYKTGEYVSLERFNDYFDGKPKLDKVTFRITKDQNAANLALQNGEINLKSIQPSDRNKVEKASAVNIITYPENRLSYATFNENQPALKSKELRQALSYALDREDIIDAAYGSDEYAKPASSFLTENTKYFTDKVETYDQDIAKAKKLVKESGFDTSQKLTVYYLNNSKSQESIALYLQQQYKEIGVTLDLKPTDPNALSNITLDRKNADYSIALNGYIMGNDPDAYKSLYLSDAPYNYSNYHNKDLDALWEKGAVTADDKERQEIYEKIQKTIADDAVIYPISYDNAVLALDSRYGGQKAATPQPVTMFRDLSKLYLTE
ncbi:ABC transporter substrate-binding protein [Listeria swaminathanii]|uniref:ABC transporter substrate-binding protein n=1 Tax=Listeria swaminathanii TaxID=2713501 RepID=A0ABU2IHF1_9LIST|nr:ABC transporter substrate-binding protein [Listeria swaminathanii]MDT0017400.1 ABC transporter substrate-binding protein [Listeria swaminathanii]MDT0023354.1 ABC transporter substrate-binding protein [Listeria swaminathanii]MDT0034296.1 ABC transporter substrate-binding protein [Listeria swaminathanii]MDT0053119.1 ABC transporter substrate-binding protein [Listeria swaminathanii]MDT0055884.1 ABC transporter substrate-binding protein [Listeria swaminathanii]